ncbi:ubiquitin carboxyl-terminal hydrolase 29-like isoform X2 [Sardina pilchardus]|uniref:ubiquitin carboxyl-terminal hydrolase 29-like isoform X2 n=1 Tax=Sardina pilchardus TaxID=27697 RepID=UPI002E0FFDD8
MLCCPCFPIGKLNKVHPVPVGEAAIPRPQRVRRFFKRLRRLLKKKEKKTVESVPPQTDTFVVEGPVKDEAPSPGCKPEGPVTSLTPHAPEDLTKEEEEEEERKGEAEIVRGPRHETPQSLKEEGGEYTSPSHAPVTETSSGVTSVSSHAPVKETLSGATSVSSLDRLAVQVMDQSGGRASRGRSRSSCPAPTTPTAPEPPRVLFHQYLLQLKCRGLPNLGQTCYVNAVLQCLFHLQPLSAQLERQEDVWSAMPEALLIGTYVELVRLRGSPDLNIKAAVVFEFKETIALYNPEFEGNSQNDAHEFLSECLQRLSAIGETVSMGDVAYQCPVDTLFSFQLRYTRTCQSCGVESSRDELNTMLSLDLTKKGSVANSLQLYFAETAVEFRCDCCGGRGSSLRCHLHTLPQVLILHLKRFCPLTLTKQHQAVRLDPVLNLRALGERTENTIRTPSPPARGDQPV